jgi:enoyl-[acyl-carrier protein] reductase I
MSKWALILGGSTGLGLASAKKLAREKFNLVIFFRDRKAGAEKAEEAFNSMRALGVDVLAFNRDAIRVEFIEEAVAELREKLNGHTFQIVLHSIAKGNLKLMGPYKEVAPRTTYTEEMVDFLDQEFSRDTQFLKGEDFTLTIEAMATSFYSWSKALFDASLIGEGTSLLAFTSEGARKAWRNYGAVSAAKAALEAISRNMALEYAPYGIRSNIIQAGVTDTAALNKIKGNQLMKEHSMLRNPFGRLTQPEDVGNAVYLMSLPEAKWINGAIIPVDGGESIA